MFDAALAFNLVEHLARAAQVGGPPGYNRVLSAHRGPHRTLDGHVALMPYTDEHWNALFAAVGKEELLEQPFFADHRSRLTHADEVYGMLASIVAERTTDEWIELGHANGIPVAPVPPLEDIVAEPAHHRGVLTRRRAPGDRAVPPDQAADPVLRLRTGRAPPGPAALGRHRRRARAGRLRRRRDRRPRGARRRRGPQPHPSPPTHGGAP